MAVVPTAAYREMLGLDWRQLSNKQISERVRNHDGKIEVFDDLYHQYQHRVLDLKFEKKLADFVKLLNKHALQIDDSVQIKGHDTIFRVEHIDYNYLHVRLQKRGDIYTVTIFHDGQEDFQIIKA